MKTTYDVCEWEKCQARKFPLSVKIEQKAEWKEEKMIDRQAGSNNPFKSPIHNLDCIFFVEFHDVSNANAATHIFSIFRKQPAEQEIKLSEFCYMKCSNLHGNGHLFLSVHSFASIVHSHNKKKYWMWTAKIIDIHKCEASQRDEMDENDNFGKSHL